jgi:hypothetical protein
MLPTDFAMRYFRSRSIMCAIEHLNQLSGRWGWMLASGVIDVIRVVIVSIGASMAGVLGARLGADRHGIACPIGLTPTRPGPAHEMPAISAASRPALGAATVQRLSQEGLPLPRPACIIYSTGSIG